MPWSTFPRFGDERIGARSRTEHALNRRSRSLDICSQCSLGSRSLYGGSRYPDAGAGSGSGSGFGSAIEAGVGGASNVWLVASHAETAVQVSVLIRVRFVVRRVGLSDTFNDEGFSEPVCFCAGLVVNGKSG